MRGYQKSLLSFSSWFLIDLEPNYYRSGHAGSSSRALTDIFRMSDVRFLSVLTDIWIRKSIATLLRTPVWSNRLDKNIHFVCQLFSFKSPSELCLAVSGAVWVRAWWRHYKIVPESDDIRLITGRCESAWPGDISIVNTIATIHPRCQSQWGQVGNIHLIILHQDISTTLVREK